MRTGMKKSKKLSIVLDANWYVSACISRKSRRTIYYDILKNTRLQVYYSAELIAEFSGVIVRPKFSKFITHRQVIRFKIIVMKFLLETKVVVTPDIVRDANDNYLLGICESCQAHFLITGDQDLLTLGKYQKTQIVTMGQFMQVLKA